ncbi:DUF305 domain-containing protein [Cellulomonas carbonis]|uniref:DUF305 domain-containing protein n=1 Tax=Cellulomonas carbonis T26 TaxID=947969 RepID=A0A0A0BT98_9CELL|nr:DUF305 domain-containing protein [Cellulomonas carbonis]KGM10912.1 hypothetical protein N868_13060 [Cellulomonas carbonis T26]MDT0167174.1 DUF305 domain-containing protein [Actinotalea sp. AC32]GGC13060.1 DUF305 domain-containing protein [Cellulomonas carbonis]
MTTTRRLAAPAAALALALALAACSTEAEEALATPASQATTEDDSTTDADDPAAHNDADTEFAQMMIIHHQGAIEMAELAVEQATTEEVRALGERIAAAQGPEIDLMSGWLDTWGEEQPEGAEMGGMGHEGMEMDGMDQTTVMAELGSLSGAEFDRRFLELMIEHHKGAIVMAKSERGDGENAEATRLAQKIIDDQTAEITEMTSLLNSL